jgi:hypothetical protein
MRAAVACWKPNSRPATAPRRRICEAIGGWLAQAGLRDGTMRWGHLLCARRIYCLVSAESALLPWGETLPRRPGFYILFLSRPVLPQPKRSRHLPPMRTRLRAPPVDERVAGCLIKGSRKQADRIGTRRGDASVVSQRVAEACRGTGRVGRIACPDSIAVDETGRDRTVVSHMLLFRTWTAAPGELIRAPGVGRSATQPRHHRPNPKCKRRGLP